MGHGGDIGSSSGGGSGTGSRTGRDNRVRGVGGACGRFGNNSSSSSSNSGSCCGDAGANGGVILSVTLPAAARAAAAEISAAEALGHAHDPNSLTSPMLAEKGGRTRDVEHCKMVKRDIDGCNSEEHGVDGNNSEGGYIERRGGAGCENEKRRNSSSSSNGPAPGNDRHCVDVGVCQTSCLSRLLDAQPQIDSVSLTGGCASISFWF